MGLFLMRLAFRVHRPKVKLLLLKFSHRPGLMGASNFTPYGSSLGSIRCKHSDKMAALIPNEKCLVLMDKNYF